MKTYKERLREIDNAIAGLSGDLRNAGNSCYDASRYPYLGRGNSLIEYVLIAEKSLRGEKGDYFCTRSEFEARLEDWKTLYNYTFRSIDNSKIMSFQQWIENENAKIEAMIEAKKRDFNWELSLAGKQKSKDATDTDDGANWFYRGELPPEGIECEYQDRYSNEWIKVKVKYSSTWGVVIESLAVGKGVELFFNHTEKPKFRPIRTERDELIEKAMEVCNCDKDDWCAAGIMKDLYDAGMLKSPKDGNND